MAIILATTCPRCSSHSDIYLHLKLINLGMINTYSAYLPEFSLRIQRENKVTETMPSIQNDSQSAL